jgi:hypothetical protein
MDKEYNKKYYEEHKVKMMEQMKESQKKLRAKKILNKLNNNEYKRIPNSALEKNNIKYNNETKTYFI